MCRVAQISCVISKYYEPKLDAVYAQSAIHVQLARAFLRHQSDRSADEVTKRNVSLARILLESR